MKWFFVNAKFSKFLHNVQLIQEINQLILNKFLIGAKSKKKLNFVMMANLSFVVTKLNESILINLMNTLLCLKISNIIRKSITCFLKMRK